MDQTSELREKIGRAREHIRAMESEFIAFLATEPYGLTGRFEGEQNSFVYRVQVRKEIPTRTRILAGEAVQQLRTVLDHLVWSLALLNTANPRGTTEFPVFAEKPKYLRDLSRKIGDLSTVAQSGIEAEQPFHSTAPHEHPLWTLHRLSNVDKHRSLTIIGACPHGIGFDPATVEGGECEFTAYGFRELRDQAVVGSLKLASHVGWDAYPRFVPQFQLEFYLGEMVGGEKHSAARALLSIAEAVDEIVTRFAPLLTGRRTT